MEAFFVFKPAGFCPAHCYAANPSGSVLQIRRVVLKKKGSAIAEPYLFCMKKKDLILSYYSEFFVQQDRRIGALNDIIS